MKSFLFSFIVTFLAGLAIEPLTAAYTRWANKRFPPPESCATASVQIFPKVWLLRTAIALLFVTLSCILIFLSVAILIATGLIHDFMVLLLALVSFLGVSACYISVASFLRCTTCTRHLLIQWTEDPPYGEETKKAASWYVIALKAITNKKFRCMYCGQQYFMKIENHQVTQPS